MRESKFQAHLIDTLTEMFPGCFILKNDPEYKQGVPDLIILYRDMWAMLEVKTSANAKERPNQRYYVEMLNDMSFAAFIHPDNEADVLYELQQAFTPTRYTRHS